MKYQSVDHILRDADTLIRQGSTKQGAVYELPSPIMFELTDSMARFSCIADRNSVAIPAAESLYLLSGMTGSDFIKEFREGVSSKMIPCQNSYSLGSVLRFQGQKTENVLDYRTANAFRQKNIGFNDQLAQVVAILKKDKTNKDAVIQFASIQNPLDVHSVWFYSKHDMLEMLVSTGYIDVYKDLVWRLVSPFAFLHQIVSDLTEIPMGSSRFVIGCLCVDEIVSSSFFQNLTFPEIDTHNFRYPNGKLTLRDMDTLMSIMIEFVSRLDEHSLIRANPFEGDERVQMWSDYAEIFRAWKAEKLGYKAMMEHSFYHPQLRFIYKGEAL